jgi:hypothetical protein
VPQTFTATLLKDESMDATGIEVPVEVVQALGAGKRPAVTVTIGDYSYRTTVAPYAGRNLIPFAKEHRERSGISPGDAIEVTLELDTAPRTVELPDDLAVALAARPGARDAFDRLSYTYRKEHVRSVESAKAAETRQRRIARIVEELAP